LRFIFNDIFTWDGWGGLIRLAAGRCHLWLFDLRKVSGRPEGMIFMQPFVGVIQEIDPGNPVSLRSVTSHVATMVVRRFNIDPRRLLWVEYVPERIYGGQARRTVPEKLDQVELNWVEGKAMIPGWRPLDEPLRTLVKGVIAPVQPDSP
jgi:hypothetical protein